MSKLSILRKMTGIRQEECLIPHSPHHRLITYGVCYRRLQHGSIMFRVTYIYIYMYRIVAYTERGLYTADEKISVICIH